VKHIEDAEPQLYNIESVRICGVTKGLESDLGDVAAEVPAREYINDARESNYDRPLTIRRVNISEEKGYSSRDCRGLCARV
jgi:hypothetical protein